MKAIEVKAFELAEDVSRLSRLRLVDAAQIELQRARIDSLEKALAKAVDWMGGALDWFEGNRKMPGSENECKDIVVEALGLLQ